MEGDKGNLWPEFSYCYQYCYCCYYWYCNYTTSSLLPAQLQKRQAIDESLAKVRKLAATQRRRRMLSQIFTSRSNQKKMDDTKNITGAGFYFFKQSTFRSKKSTANSWSKLLEVECRTFSPATDKCIKAEVSVKKKRSCPVTSKPKGGEKWMKVETLVKERRASMFNPKKREWLDWIMMDC